MMLKVSGDESTQ